MINIQGKRTVDSIHKELGKLMWENCGMARSAEGLRSNLAKIPGSARGILEQRQGSLGRERNSTSRSKRPGGWRISWNLAELMCLDALERAESCGGHFRVESQTPDGEAKRDDERFSFVSAWEWKGEGDQWELHKEPLAFEHVHLAQRSYK